MGTDDEDDEEDNFDREEIWDDIASMAAKYADVSIAQARAILEAEGQHAYRHSGALDAVNTVLWRMGKPQLKGDVP